MDATSQPYLPARGRFEGAKVVLVGGAGGIGAVMSSRFAAEGATVLVLDRDENAAAEKVRSITAGGGCAEAYTLDATNVTHINEVFGRVIAEHETLDVLVNLPYSLTDAHFEDVTEAEFDCDIHATFKAPFFCIQRAIPALLASQRGASIVNIGSVNGLRAFGSEVYSGAKAALQNLTMNLACRYGRFGVRVNLVACGTVRTPAWGARRTRPKHARVSIWDVSDGPGWNARRYILGLSFSCFAGGRLDHG